MAPTTTHSRKKTCAILKFNQQPHKPKTKNARKINCTNTKTLVSISIKEFSKNPRDENNFNLFNAIS